MESPTKIDVLIGMLIPNARVPVAITTRRNPMRKRLNGVLHVSSLKSGGYLSLTSQSDLGIFDSFPRDERLFLILMP